MKFSFTHRDVTGDEFGRHLDTLGQAACLHALDKRAEAGAVLIGAPVEVLKKLATGDATTIVAHGGKWCFIVDGELYTVSGDELTDVIRWQKRTTHALEVAYANAVDAGYNEEVNSALFNSESTPGEGIPPGEVF